MSGAGFTPVLAAALVIIGVLTSIPAGVQSIGVCYGLIGNDLPPRSNVVELYKSKGIINMRLYSPDRAALDALRGSGIGLILGTTNDDVRSLASSQPFAASWVEANVKPYYPAVKIKYIAVGNEISGDVARSILPAMRNLNCVLATAGLGAIKVSTAVRFDVIAHSFPPSKGAFRDPSVMVPVAQYLERTGAPLLANVYPYFAYSGSPGDINLGYALFQPRGTPPVRDDGSGLLYTNLFDAMVDAIYAALEKAGAARLKVVVSETGWPSAGGVAATVENARAYNQGLIDHVAHGTPKRRSRRIEAYLFAMFNENLKPGDAMEKNFGLFFPNKSPVYPISFPRSNRNAASLHHLSGKGDYFYRS